MIQSFLSPSLLAITFSNELHAFNNELQLLCVATVPPLCRVHAVLLHFIYFPIYLSWPSVAPCAKRADGPVMVL